VTNSERADQLLADAEAIAGEMRSALALHRWNLAVRQYPRTHDPVPALIDTIRQRRVDADQAFLDRLRSLSRELADLRGPAFYQEIALREDQARAAVDGAEKALRFGRVLIDQLRGDG
jgi:HEPN domain-containing protein